MYSPDTYPWTYTLLDTYPPDIYPPGHLPPGHLPPGQIPSRTYTPQRDTPPHNLKCLICVDYILYYNINFARFAFICNVDLCSKADPYLL